MDIKIFTEMLKYKHFCNYKKLKYKYGEYFDNFISTLAELYYKELPINDFKGNAVVYIENHVDIHQSALKLMLQPQNKGYGEKAAEEEIIASSAIEDIDFSRDSVRNILKGLVPKDEVENRILGQKKGLEFISDTHNSITEENLYKLYMMTVGDFLSSEDKLLDGNYYRHDSVFVVSDHIEHAGIDCRLIPASMSKLISFINSDDGINDLIKAAIIHFYIAYIHPYFDGNGRIARLVHLWFLIQKGYQSALFIPFSSCIQKTRKDYYEAYTSIEENFKLTKKIDVTPFLMYFAEKVYNKIPSSLPSTDVLSEYSLALNSGNITEKEKELWQFVLSKYGTDEFSTKQLEKDFGNAAYATIRAFVLKFENLGLLDSVKYGARVKYFVSHQ